MEEAERASSHAFSMFSAARARMAGAASCVLPPFLRTDSPQAAAGRTQPSPPGLQARRADGSVDSIFYSHESVTIGAPKVGDEDGDKNGDLPQCIV